MENTMLKNYKHLLLESILLLGEMQRRLAETDKLSPDDKYKAKDKIVDLSLNSLQLLHAIDPCIDDAKKEFPQLIEFLNSCSDALIKIKKDLKA